MTAVLTISDGSTTIDLMSATGPYFVSIYETGINQWKNGGLFSDSQFSGGSIPIYRQFANFEEKLTIHITGTTQDDVIANLRALYDLLDSAVEYFISGMGNQAWLAVKANTETNTRYAVIVAYKLESLPSQFSGAFEQGASGSINYNSAYINIELILQRDIWLEAAPGTETRCYIDGEITYNSVDLGIPTTNTQNILISNFKANQNITHIYRGTAAGVWSSNLISATPPFDLFPGLAEGDSLFIGVDSTVTDAHFVPHVVFNIGTAATDLDFINYRWNGSSWAQVDRHQPDDETGHPFLATGVYVFWLNSAGGWGGTTTSTGNLQTIFGGSAPNVTGYWYRLYVVSGTSIPTQATRMLYAPSQSYLDIQSTGLGGDLRSLSKIKYKVANRQYANRLIVGARTLSRGTNFNAFIGLSDAQVPSGITVSVVGSPYLVFAAVNSPTGRAVYGPIAETVFPDFDNIVASTEILVTIDSTLATHYRGKYRAFLDYIPGSTWNETGYSLIGRLTVGSTANASDYVIYPEVELNGDSGSHGLADFGIIELPAALPRYGEDIQDIVISLQFVYTGGGAGVDIGFVDLILIPADESIMEISANIIKMYSPPTVITAVANGNWLTIDKISGPVDDVNISIFDVSSGYLVSKPTYSGDNGIYLSDEQQRLWFLPYLRNTSNSQDNATESNRRFPTVGEVAVYKLNRYLLPRGSS